ncbi:MAG: type II toxin-antitoxin system Phd/YefM family antitoxin [Verrucomicrobiales bacterium]|nr:type II toxin-antitoxin system Phd/YefM family antitoxin [Verrucomicrobiales bacterium]
MISANMHEAKTRLSELVKAVVERGERVLLCRDGEPVVELIRHQPSTDRLTPSPDLHVTFAPGFDPAEPASEEDWPEEGR